MQRRVKAPNALDDFPTPPWAARALIEMLGKQGIPIHLHTIWEPACNRGYLARGFADYVGWDSLYLTDIHDYGFDGMDAQFDFLSDWGSEDLPDVDWIFTNPPFKTADQFIRLGLERARCGVGVLVRTAFDEGEARYRTLFRDHAETYAFPFIERVVMHRGVLRQAGARYVDDQGVERRASTATAYQWLVWRKDIDPQPTIKVRIPPCRAKLECIGDYPDPEVVESDGQPELGLT